MKSSSAALFAQILKRYDRVAIAGGPRVGKSTLAKLVKDRKVIATDDYKSKDWSDVPLLVIRDAAGLKKFVIEGVQTSRSLRKGLEVDAVIYLTTPKLVRTKGQDAMAKGVATVFAEWRKKNSHVPLFIEDV